MNGGMTMSNEPRRTGAARGAVWGGFLIILGGLMLLELFTALSAWVWVGFFVIMGIAFIGVYAMDTTKRGSLVPAYIMLAIAGLIALIELDILRDEAVAIYVLSTIALPFLVGFLRSRERWGLLIPAYILFAVAGMIALTSLSALSDNLVVSYILFANALPWLIVFVLNRKHWWALIPGGITAVVGLAFLLTDEFVQYVGPALIILAGAWILLRGFFRKEPEIIEAPDSAIVEVEEREELSE
jgi:hypothetical protein